MERLLSERRAGKYLADLVIGGSSTPLVLYQAMALDPIRPALILPEVIDESRWWKGKHRYNDPEERFVFQYIGHPQIGNISYNTQLVDPKQFRSFWDFVHPIWKGKIALRDFRGGGAGNSNMKLFYYNPELGTKFIRRLFGEMDITLFRDTRQSVDWLGTGKFPICFFCYPEEVARAQKQGLPVAGFEAVMREGAALVSHSGSVSLVNRAPHPNAAKVFINWLLSREGQLTMQRVYVEGRLGASNSLRMDIPKDMVPQHERLLEGVNYIQVETPERSDMGPIIRLVDEILAAKGRR
jgi:iron(III) transport system substrate-binding protein